MKHSIYRILCVSVINAVMAASIYASEFLLPLPLLEGAYPYGSYTGPVEVNISSELYALSNMTVSISGVHSNGWWDGDDLWDFYHGPRGATIEIIMNVAGGFPWMWQGTLRLSHDGSFSTNVVLGLSSGNWDFLKDGVTDLQVLNAIIFGFGNMTEEPYVDITNISLTIEGCPLPRFTSLKAGGTLSWSKLPTGGHLELFGTTSLTNSWEPVAVFTNQENSYDPSTTNQNECYFYKAIWVEDSDF